MIWADSHCHLDLIDLSSYQNHLSFLLQLANEKGVNYFLSAGVDLKSTPKHLSLLEGLSNVYTSIGLHPSEVMSQQLDRELFFKLAQNEKVVAIGETGLDYHYRDSDQRRQREIFKEQIILAKELNKPLIVHSREAKADTIQTLKEEGANKVGGVLHCFTGDLEMAKLAIEMGFYIGISGIVTFSNATSLQKVVFELPLEYLLLETDSPWLAPHPFRGESNTPEYIPLIGEKVAQIKGVSVENVAQKTTENFLRLFLDR